MATAGRTMKGAVLQSVCMHGK